MTLGRMTQVCFIVKNFDDALAYWTGTMEIGPFFFTELPPYGLYRGKKSEATLKMAAARSGDMSIEVLQQTNDAPSVFREILETRGEGVHHVMFAAADYDATLAQYQARGREVAFAGVVPLPGMGRGAMIDTRQDNGAFTEVIEPTPALIGIYQKFDTASGNWDRKTRPIRPFTELLP